MTMESFATPYPVVFYDGEKEHNKGHIGVHSVLTFKRFQSLLCQKVGLPSGQISAVFVCRRTSKDTISDRRQKLPINENTNFSIILNQHNPKWEKDCHFLVTTKKWKKERKGGMGRRKGTDQQDNREEFTICQSKGYSSDHVQKDMNTMACTDSVNYINTKQSFASDNMLSSTNVEDMHMALMTGNGSYDESFEHMAVMTGNGYKCPVQTGNTQQFVEHLHLNGDAQQLNLSTDCHGSFQTNILSSQTRQEHNNQSPGADNYTSLQCMMNPRFNNQKPCQERRTRSALIPDNSSSSPGVPEHHQNIMMSSPSAPNVNMATSHHVKLLSRSDQKILLTRGDQQAALMNSSPLISTTTSNMRLHEKMFSMDKQLGANMTNILSRGPGICNFYPRQALQDGAKLWLRNHAVDQPNMLLRDDHSYKSWQSYHYHHNLSTKASEEFQERCSDPLFTRPSLIQARDRILNSNALSKDDQMMFPSPTGGNNSVFLLKNSGLLLAGPNNQQSQTHYQSYNNVNSMIPQQQSLATSDLHQNVNATLDMSKIRGLVCSLNSGYQNNINHSLSASSTILAHGGVLCQQCYKYQQSKIDPPPFHLCVQDKITAGFRGPSPAGPIERPAAKSSLEFIAAA